MDDDESFINFQGGTNRNSLFNILQLNETLDEDIQPIRHSPYYDLDNFKLLAERHNKRFNILSVNIESINANHSETEAFLEELNLINFKFTLIYFQECWLSENDDMCYLQLEGYQCIKQGKTCSNKGGLVVYLNKTFNYKVILSLNQYDNWEGQFIKVTGGGLSKDIIIGNIYRPPKDLKENYKQFLYEFTPIISSFDRTNSDIIIAGDFDI